ncbi:hypothetical protein [Streptomyces sp. DHE17-7]|uniref:hypothetical protein n=1 Tax=Streptomyces sp. DHE17-7 TaxID=2759949 RepID=UPI000EC626A5|nr:hypothetical protein [Streptomyces sp. DHE17-7]MBJ6623553.1 hypothetical protein [Streptomyces sp. DHE17-7]RIH58531.1 hypothetical protein D3C59_34545 [Streptomyces sp. SHP22-7]
MTTAPLRVDTSRATTAARNIERAVHNLQTTLKRASWPRPPLVHDHRVLFREPTYQDGQPYADDLDEDDESATITP